MIPYILVVLPVRVKNNRVQFEYQEKRCSVSNLSTVTLIYNEVWKVTDESEKVGWDFEDFGSIHISGVFYLQQHKITETPGDVAMKFT